MIEMKEKGLGGFFLCARQGLRTPYLSREWFELCRYTVDVARELGLEVWLYDEYPYPSGMSGGRVTWLHPEAKHVLLDITLSETIARKPVVLDLGAGLLVSARAYPCREGSIAWDQGIDLAENLGVMQNYMIYQRTAPGASYAHNSKRFFSYGPSETVHWTPPDTGEWKLIVAMTHEMDDFKYYGSYLDPVNPEAVRAFQETTYEMYRKELGDDFGSTVMGMFGDETGFHGQLPWTKELPSYYKGKYGSELTAHMAALVDSAYPDAALIRYRYYQCVHEMLRDRYHKTLSGWCEQNGIRYTTEVPSMRMSNQQYSHVPGGDPCHDKLGFPIEQVIERDFHVFRSNPKAISAMARQFDRKDCLIEGFHSIGWTMTLQDAKWQIDRQTLMGITLHNFHAFYYTVDGITKHDAPPSQFFQNPYWAHYRLFADYCGRSSRFVAETDSLAEVALLHPATSWWTHLRNPFIRFAYTGTNPAEKQASDQLIADWKHLCKSLLFHQIDYDDLDPEVMLLGRIEQGNIVVGRARYRTLVIPPLTNLEYQAADMIRQFVESGGTVICCGLVPYEVIETAIDPATFITSNEALAQSVYFGEPGTAVVSHDHNIYAIHAPGGLSASGAGDLIAATVHATTACAIKVSMPESLNDSVIVHRRYNASGRYIMLSSQNGVHADVQVTFDESPVTACLVELDLETGQCNDLETVRNGQELSLAVHLSPWQSRIIALSVNRNSPVAAKPAATLQLKLSMDRTMPVRISGLNVYRLEQMHVSIDGASEHAARPGTFIEHFKLSEQMNADQLKIEGGFGTPQKITIQYPREETCRYTFTIVQKPQKAYLLRDQMAIMGEYKININGQTLEPDAFQPVMVYDPCNRMADIAAYLQTGQNTLMVTVTALADYHGVSDPMYLLGDFGVVSRDGTFVIDALPIEAALTSGPIAGYPFYSGTLTFLTTLAIEQLTDNDQFALSLPETLHLSECLELIINGRSLGVRAFAPYTWTGDTCLLRAGSNDVQVKLTNTLANLFEGIYFDFAQQKMCEIQPDQ